MLTVAKDRSTYVVTVTFTDENGAAVVPNAVTWNLKCDGRIVNSRQSVVATPGATVTIVLSGDDIDFTTGEERELEVFSTYNSTNGTDLPLNESARFFVEDV